MSSFWCYLNGERIVSFSTSAVFNIFDHLLLSCKLLLSGALLYQLFKYSLHWLLPRIIFSCTCTLFFNSSTCFSRHWHFVISESSSSISHFLLKTWQITSFSPTVKIQLDFAHFSSCSLRLVVPILAKCLPILYSFELKLARTVSEMPIGMLLSDRHLTITLSTRIWCGVRLCGVICALGSSERSTRGQPVRPGDDMLHK